MIAKRLVLPRMRPRPRTMVSMGPRAAWRKIALTWRKTMRSLAPLAMMPSRRLANWQTWAPHVHLDVSFAGIAAGATPRGALPPRAATVILWRKFDTRLATRLPIVREMAALRLPGIARHLERHIATRLLPWRQTRWHQVDRFFRSNPSPSPRVDRRVYDRAAVPPRFSRGHRSATESLWRRRHVGSQIQPAPGAVALLLRRVPSNEQAALVTPAAARPLRLPDLVWRKQADDANTTAERSLGALAASAAPAVHVPQTSRRSTPSPETIDSQRPPLLDPALIDRVAEDVIGRVEKRIRIERERRGV